MVYHGTLANSCVGSTRVSLLNGLARARVTCAEFAKRSENKSVVPGFAVGVRLG